MTANGATLAACTLDGFDATVTAEIPVAGIGLARKLLGYSPAIGLEEGLRRMLEHRGATGSL